MIGYVTLGTRDFDKAAAFYDGLLQLVGAGRLRESETFIAWSAAPNKPGLSIVRTPADGKEATPGNGVMVALAVDAPDKVDALHARALELGGSDEGAPGPRGDNFYAGYFRDLDGNKLNAFCITAAD